MPSDKPLLRLDDVLENIRRIRSYTVKYTFERFLNDPKCRDAVGTLGDMIPNLVEM